MSNDFLDRVMETPIVDGKGDHLHAECPCAECRLFRLVDHSKGTWSEPEPLPPPPIVLKVDDHELAMRAVERLRTALTQLLAAFPDLGRSFSKPEQQQAIRDACAALKETE